MKTKRTIFVSIMNFIMWVFSTIGVAGFLAIAIGFAELDKTIFLCGFGGLLVGFTFSLLASMIADVEMNKE